MNNRMTLRQLQCTLRQQITIKLVIILEIATFFETKKKKKKRCRRKVGKKEHELSKLRHMEVVCERQT